MKEYKRTVYLFTKEDGDGDTVQISSKALGWPDLVEQFHNFLLASGFILTKSALREEFAFLADEVAEHINEEIPVEDDSK
jgi:hypothetical protein